MNKLLLLLVFLIIMNCKAAAQNTLDHFIKGTVKDEKGKAIPFASVTIKDENGGISTDSLGVFTINAKPNSVLIFGSVGYETAEVNISNKTDIIVLLKRNQQALKEVSVAAKNNNINSNSTDPTIQQQQTISATVQNYTAASNISTAPTVFSQQQTNPTTGNPEIVSRFGYNAGSGKVYTGSALPQFMPKDETKGRQYLYEKWVPGVVFNEKGEQVKNDLYLFNYDKIGKALLFTQDQVSVIELDMNTVSGFTLIYQDEPRVYIKITIADKTDYYQLLTPAKGNYQLYKKTTTKFVKANYVSTGLTSSGNNYDEFVDDNRYYVYFDKDKRYETIDLKKKSIKAVLENEKPKVDTWFLQNGNADIDERFVKGLIDYLNQ
jgi:hypothetical protein